MKFNYNSKINNNEFNSKLSKKFRFEKIIKNEENKNLTINLNDLKDLNLINQIDQKFILAINNKNKKLLLFDQHAIHERIRYEYFIGLLYNKIIPFNSVFIKENKNKISNSIKKVHIFNEYFENDDEFILIEKYFNKLKKMNIILNYKNKKYFIIQSIEIFGFKINKKYIKQILLDFDNNYKIPLCLNDILKSYSCKRAIKFNEKVNKFNLELIIKDLKFLKNGLFCIHGRNSTIILE